MAEAQTQLGVWDITTHTPIIYPHLVKPRKYHEGQKDEGKPYYEVQWLLTPEQYTEAAKIAATVARAQFPGRDFKTLKFPFVNGDQFAAQEGKKGRDFAVGHVLLTCRSPGRPHMAYVGQGNKVVKIERDDDAAVAAAQRFFYSGVLSVGSVNFAAYEGMGGGVKAYINQLMSLNRGERIAGGVNLEDKFGGYIGLTSDEDPTIGKALGGEIPL